MVIFPSLSLRNPANQGSNMPGIWDGWIIAPSKSKRLGWCLLSQGPKGLRGDQRIRKRADIFVVIQNGHESREDFFWRFQVEFFFFWKDPMSANRQNTWGRDPDRPRSFFLMIWPSIYSFFHNHGSGKWLHLKRNYYWRDQFTSMIKG